MAAINSNKKMSKNEKKVLLEGLEEERDTYQAILKEIREERSEKVLSTHKEFEQFTSHVGVLSFAIAAAITPVMIVADQEILNRGFLIAGLLIYLMVGLIALLNLKQSIERKINDYSSMGIDMEADIEKITNSINKLLWNPDGNEYRSEYLKTKKQFVNNHGKVTAHIDKTNYLLDILVGGFIIATFISLKTVWPFDSYLYWCLGSAAILVIAIVVIRSSKQARISNDNRKKLSDRYQKIRDDFLEWQDKEVFRND